MATQAPAVSQPAKVSIWSAIGHFFKHVGVVVSVMFVDLFGSDAAHNFAASAEAVLKSGLGQIALTAVTEAEKLEAGTDKAAVAATNIFAVAKQQGISATTSVVNMLIELAVQKIHGEFGPDPAAAS